VDEGETISANTPLLRIVEIDRMIAAITVTERDYAYLHTGQEATLVTDTYPGMVFRGKIKRIAPVFRETTRQARVEIEVPNPERLLKPGMFMRATLILDRIEETAWIPESALTRRENTDGVFVLSPDGESVRWAEVTTGLRDGEKVELFGVEAGSHVVILGQHLLDDGSKVTLPEPVEADQTP
jgi:RND family efflux transporter MFP subunit